MIETEADKIVEEYLEDCKARLSPHTVKNRKSSLDALRKFLGDMDVTDSTKSEVRGFLNDLKHRGRARSTISGRLSAIRSFFKYVETYHDLTVPDLEDIDIEDYPKATWEGQGQEALTRNEVRALIEAPDNLRDTLIIAILYYLGLRANELALLKVENVGTQNRIVEVIGKGNKPRKIPYSSKLDRAIHLWLHYERRSYVNSDGPYFFPSKHDKYLRTNTIARIVYKSAEKTGIQKVVGKRSDGKKIYKVHPHILRHSYATHAADDDIPIALIQKMMGHSHIGTTIRYTGESSVFKSYHEKFKGV